MPETTALVAASSLVIPDSKMKTEFDKQKEFPFSYLLKSNSRVETHLGDAGWQVDHLTDEDRNINMPDWRKPQRVAHPQVSKGETKEKAPTPVEIVNKQQEQVQVQSPKERAEYCNELLSQAKTTRVERVDKIDANPPQNNQDGNIHQQAQERRRELNDDQVDNQTQVCLSTIIIKIIVNYSSQPVYDVRQRCIGVDTTSKC